MATKVPAMASIRRRSPSDASIEIIRISTHIEQGLKPSSRPMMIVNNGKPRSLTPICRPTKGMSTESPAAGLHSPASARPQVSPAATGNRA